MPNPLSRLWRALPVGLSALLMLGGCSLIDAKKDDYKRANRLPSLEIPPSLSVPQADDRYTIPDPKDVAASATYSEYAKTRGLPTLPGGYVPGVGVDPQSAQAHIDVAGAERWLVVNGTPEQVWATCKTFLTENGYEIAAENPTLGILETQWVTSRPHLEDDGILRNVLNSLFTNDNSNGIRDRYRLRVDAGRKPGTSEVFVSHRGLEEVSVATNDRTVWQARASEPDKEAEMLKRLLVKFGVDIPAADQQIANAKVDARQPSATDADVASGSAAVPKVAPSVANARLDTSASGEPGLVLAEAFDPAWRRLGLAAEKAGLTVQEQDREKGVLSVQYSADKVKDGTGETAKEKKGIGALFASAGRAIWKKITETDESIAADKAAAAKAAQRPKLVTIPDGVYQLTVSKTDASRSRVTVLDKAGQAPAPDVARHLLDILAVRLQ